MSASKSFSLHHPSTDRNKLPSKLQAANKAGILPNRPRRIIMAAAPTAQQIIKIKMTG